MIDVFLSLSPPEPVHHQIQPILNISQLLPLLTTFTAPTLVQVYFLPGLPPRFLPKWNEDLYSHENLYVSIYSGFIHIP